MEISNCQLNIIKFCDYVPGVSTITNLFHIFQKYYVIPEMDPYDVACNRYYNYVNDTILVRNIILTIPILGNGIVLLVDLILYIIKAFERCRGEVILSERFDLSDEERSALEEKGIDITEFRGMLNDVDFAMQWQGGELTDEMRQKLIQASAGESVACDASGTRFKRLEGQALLTLLTEESLYDREDSAVLIQAMVDIYKKTNPVYYASFRRPAATFLALSFHAIVDEFLALDKDGILTPENVRALVDAVTSEDESYRNGRVKVLENEANRAGYAAIVLGQRNRNTASRRLPPVVIGEIVKFLAPPVIKTPATWATKIAARVEGVPEIQTPAPQ